MAKLILVVDDEPDFLELLKVRLEANNYEVIAVTSAKEGLSLAKAKRPNLIILDILMPEMDGTAMAEVLKEDPATSKIPLIFLTGIVKEGEVKERGRSIGGNTFIAKPFDTEELLLTIARVLQDAQQKAV